MRASSSLRRVLALAVLLLVVQLAACGSTTPPAPTATATGTPSISPTVSPTPEQLKPVLRGLLDRDGPPPPAFVSLVGGYVVNVHWSDLQLQAGGPITPNNAIDGAIAQVRSINAADHTSLGLKLRIFAGIWAPAWAKNLGGSPIPVTDPVSGGGGTIGRFWTSAFGNAYSAFEAELAAKYDDVPEIREVTISRCTTVFAEPFIRDSADPATVSALLAAGYSLSADETCQEQEVTAHLVWRHTHSDLSFNPYQVINADGSTAADEPFTQSMMAFCRQTLGSACVLENNSLKSAAGRTFTIMYSAMQALGAPISFQTAVTARVGNLNAAIEYAISLGANSVELPGGFQSEGPSAFTNIASQLRANPAA
jgi:hypothetical protein